MTSFTKVSALSVFALLVLAGAGCNPFASVQQNIADRITEKAVESQTGGRVKIDSNSGDVTFENQDENGMMRIGEGIKLPDNFPGDIPRYPNASYVSAVVLQDGTQAIGNFKTTDDAEAVKAWFDDELQKDGFARSMDIPVGFIRLYEKDNVKITVQVQPPEEGGAETVVSLQRIESK